MIFLDHHDSIKQIFQVFNDKFKHILVNYTRQTLFLNTHAPYSRYISIFKIFHILKNSSKTSKTKYILIL